MQRLLVALAGSLALAACTGSTGPQGPAGSPCAVTDNGDGTKTITCPGSAPVTIANGERGQTGADGTDCSVTDNGGGQSTIACTDGTSVTVSSGTSCSAVDNGDGTKTITCPGSAPVTVADGTSCSLIDNHDGVTIVSCTDGHRALLASPLPTHLDPAEDLPGVVITTAPLGGHSNADGSFHAGDHIGVTFSVKTSGGRMIPVGELDELGVWVAGPSGNYQHLLPAARDQVMYSDLRTAATLNDDGTYTYHVPDAIPASYGQPLFDTTRFTDGELTGALQAGTYTLGLVAAKNYLIEGLTHEDGNSKTVDFGLDTTTVSHLAVVADTNCATCHQQLRVHGGSYRSVSTCVTCHTSGAEDVGSTATGDTTPVTIEFRVMIHKLHSGTHLPSVNGITVDASGNKVFAATGTPYLVGDADFSAIQYPIFPNFNISMPKDSGYSALSSTNKSKMDKVMRGVTACATCHGDPDGAGPAAAPADGARAFTAPSKRTCGSCHDDLDYSKPYVASGFSMPAGTTEAQCSTCHNETGITAAHRHPLTDAAVNPETTFTITGLGGASGAGGKFLAGDPIDVNFTIKDAGGADVPITYFDSLTAGVVGPTQARQVLFAGQPGSPIDFAGRLQSASTTNKGTMLKVQPGGTLVSETLLVNFTSATAFDLSGLTTGVLGSGTLGASAGTQPTGSSITNLVLTSAAVPQVITVAFTSPTSYSVTGSVSGAMGTGILPASVSNTQRFTSSDGTVAFNLVVGTTAAATGNTFYITIVKGAAANPVLFGLVVGKTAFAAGDRFYYDLVAPAATYALRLPADLQLEYLGDGNGTAAQVFTAANLPVRQGRQTLFERTALVGTATTVAAATGVMARFVNINAIDAGLASNDYVVIDDGLPTEEYARVSAITTATKRLQLSTPLRYAHAAGATFQEATLTQRLEGSYYTLNPTTGQVTLTGTSTTGNAFVMTYRTDARFGWKRGAGDTLAAFYYAPLSENTAQDETWGDWRGKPLVDGTYTASLWGYHAIEYRSGALGTGYEWQTYRATTRLAEQNFLYGATATTLAPYAKIPAARDTCNGCHGDLSFHGGGRRGADTCLQCHATPGPQVHFRTLAHEFHEAALPVMPNGSAACATCHGANDVSTPTARNHPTVQSRPTRDWSLTCTACHSSPIAAAHAETMTATSTGVESCATCHGPNRDLAVELMHKAR